MFSVKKPEEVLAILSEEFPNKTAAEYIPLAECCGRVLSENITAREMVPGFRRSTVDGYAVIADDTFGCSDSIPAVLVLDGAVQMGEENTAACTPGHCMYVPTGGAVPDGADAVVMIEYSEDFGDGTIGISKPAAPGLNLVRKGDDVYPGKTVLHAGRKLTVSDIGALAAMGITDIPVHRKPLVGILSTGDELVPITDTPAPGQVRDVNSSMLDVLCREAGAETVLYGIVRDDYSLLRDKTAEALRDCDIVLISGGSSVGVKDATARVIESFGTLLVHGIAMKPGKPTIVGNAGGKPVIGLPGHPAAAFFVARIYVRALLASCTGQHVQIRAVKAVLTESVNANHGRLELCGVRLHQSDEGLMAEPIRTKSGLISSLAEADGYIRVPRDCEGFPAGAPVDVALYSID